MLCSHGRVCVCVFFVSDLVCSLYAMYISLSHGVVVTFDHKHAFLSVGCIRSLNR